MEQGSIDIKGFKKYESELLRDNDEARHLIENVNDQEAEHFFKMFFRYMGKPEGERFCFHNLSKGWAHMVRVAYRALMNRLDQIAFENHEIDRGRSARKAYCILRKNYRGDWR